MLDARPDPDGLPFPVHRVLYRYGVALLDNALLGPLAQACAEERRYEFMFMALPLNVARGTGSPVNPIALFSRSHPTPLFRLHVNLSGAAAPEACRCVLRS